MAQSLGKYEGTRLSISTKQALKSIFVPMSGRHFPTSSCILQNFKYHLFCCNYGFGVFLQDFSVTFGHCPEITVYTSCCYFPSAGQLPSLWADHRKSLLSMLVEVSALRGSVGGDPGKE